MLKRLLLLLTSFCIFSIPCPSHAETKVLTAEGTYTMGEGETMTFAESMALQKAKQMALEQAGTYVESYTKVQKYQLTADEIQTIAGGVLQVEVLDKTRTLVGDGLKFFVEIKATVTTDKVSELAQRIKGKNVAEEYKKLQEDYARLSKEIESWKQLIAKTPSGPERDAALDQIREREKAFSAIQQIETTFFQRLVAGEAIARKALDEQTTIDQLIRTIAEHGHVVEVGEAEATAVTNDAQRLMVKVPVTYKLSKTLLPSISDVARLLGGVVEPETDWKKASYERETSGPITLVRIAKNSHLSSYFQHRVEALVLALQFIDADGHPGHCVLPGWKRVFSVDEWEEQPDGSVVIWSGRWRPSIEIGASHAGFVALLHYKGGSWFGVMLPKDKVTKLEKITARFLTEDSEKEIRSQFGTEDRPSKRYECKPVP